MKKKKVRRRFDSCECPRNLRPRPRQGATATSTPTLFEYFFLSFSLPPSVSLARLHSPFTLASLGHPPSILSDSLTRASLPPTIRSSTLLYPSSLKPPRRLYIHFPVYISSFHSLLSTSPAEFLLPFISFHVSLRD